MRKKRLLTLLSCLGLAVAFALAAFLASQLMRRSQRDRPHSYSPEQLRVDLDGTLGQSGICGDALTWVFSAGDGTLTVSGSGEMYEFDAERFADGVPWHEYTALIRRVRAEDGVTSVSARAFKGCTALTAVRIPAGAALGEGAFYACTGLTELTLEDGVQTLGELCFYGCTALTAVCIPGSVAELPTLVFGCCTALRTLTLENGVAAIGVSAFQECRALTKLPLPASPGAAGQPAVLTITVLDRYGAGRFERLYAGLSAQ